jgi:uncharacterized membrane protein
MNDRPATQDGFFSRHPRLTINLVASSILIGSIAWVTRALSSGEGAHGATVGGSPTIFWLQIVAMSAIVLFAVILFIWVAAKTLRRGRKKLHY